MQYATPSLTTGYLQKELQYTYQSKSLSARLLGAFRCYTGRYRSESRDPAAFVHVQLAKWRHALQADIVVGESEGGWVEGGGSDCKCVHCVRWFDRVSLKTMRGYCVHSPVRRVMNCAIRCT